MTIPVKIAEDKAKNLDVLVIAHILKNCADKYCKNPSFYSSAKTVSARNKGLIRVFRLWQMLRFFLSHADGLRYFEKEVLLLFLAMQSFKSGFYNLLCKELQRKNITLNEKVKLSWGTRNFNYIFEYLKLTYNLKENDILIEIDKLKIELDSEDYPENISLEIAVLFKQRNNDPHDSTKRVEANPDEQKAINISTALGQLSFPIIHRLLSEKILKKEMDFADIKAIDILIFYWKKAKSLYPNKTNKLPPWHVDQGFFDPASPDTSYRTIITTLEKLTLDKIKYKQPDVEEKQENTSYLKNMLHKIITSDFPEGIKLILLCAIEGSGEAAKKLFIEDLFSARIKPNGALDASRTYNFILGRLLLITGGVTKHDDKSNHPQIVSYVLPKTIFLNIIDSIGKVFTNLSNDLNMDLKRVLGSLLGHVVRAMISIDVTTSAFLLRFVKDLNSACLELLKALHPQATLQALAPLQTAVPISALYPTRTLLPPLPPNIGISPNTFARSLTAQGKMTKLPPGFTVIGTHRIVADKPFKTPILHPRKLGETTPVPCKPPFRL